MSPEEIDSAIDALSDHEAAELYDSAARSWWFRAQNWVMVGTFFAVMFAVYFALVALVRAYWLGSVIATTLAIVFWTVVFYGLLRFILSMRVAMWRTRWATRREYKLRRDAA